MEEEITKQEQLQLPNSTGVLVLGILSIALCCCYGVIGIILGIIALVLASQANKIYIASPELYTVSSYKNMKAGKVCAIVGLCLSSLYFVYAIIMIAFSATGILEEIIREIT